MEYFDICNEQGEPTGRVIERSVAHAEGILHRTTHVWIIREKDGRQQVLLQKRSRDKDSYPGMYDISSAGHIPAGSEPLESAVREMSEELGIHAAPEQLIPIGMYRVQYEEMFYGKPFRDNEVVRAYIYRSPVEIGKLTLQKSEVESVRWFDMYEVYQEALTRCSETICVNPVGMKVLIDYLEGGR